MVRRLIPHYEFSHRTPCLYVVLEAIESSTPFLKKPPYLDKLNFGEPQAASVYQYAGFSGNKRKLCKMRKGSESPPFLD